MPSPGSIFLGPGFSRPGLLAVGVALMASPHLAAGEPSAATGGRRPNIVLVMSDDQGWGDVGYNGNRLARTPHLDAMAREAIRFDRFYASSPVCSPTRGSCLTGRHPSRYGIDWPDDVLPASELTLPQVLKTAGYRSGHFGKWHLGECETSGTTVTSEVGQGWKIDPASYAPPWERGFDVCFSETAGGPTYNPLVWGRDKGPGNRVIMNRPVLWGETPAVPGVVRSGVHFWTGPGRAATGNLHGDSSQLIMDRALEFIETETAAKNPFLAVVWFFAPHSPIAAGNSDRKPFASLGMEEQHWYGCLAAMDAQIGRLRQRLRELDIADNTIVWFCSDNGPSWVVEYNSAGPYRGEKGLLHEGGVRVPGILEWPARFPQPRVVSAPVCTSDFFPTLLAWAGVDLPAQAGPLDGIDVTPLLDGTQPGRPRAIAFQSPVRKGLGHDWMTDPDHWRRNEDPSTRQLALSGNRFKLFSDDNGRTFRLYDLVADPGETRDVAEAHADVMQAMRAELQAWLESCQRSREAVALTVAGSERGRRSP